METESGCWEWTGTTQTAGYGVLTYTIAPRQQTIFTAHRLAFAFLKTEKLVDGMVVDHICCNKKCVNPEHLRQTTIGENAHRDEQIKVNYSVPTLLFRGVCPNGHKIISFDDLNKNPVKKTVMRYRCKACANEQQWVRNHT